MPREVEGPRDIEDQDKSGYQEVLRCQEKLRDREILRTKTSRGIKNWLTQGGERWQGEIKVSIGLSMEVGSYNRKLHS